MIGGGITQYPMGVTKVVLSDGPQLDAFSRLRVSMSATLFDSQQEYGLDTLTTWDATANGTLSIATAASDGSVSDGAGNAVGPRHTDTRMTPVTVSATNGHYSILQSRQYTRDIPGKSHLVFITGVFATGAGYTAEIVLRTSTSGSVDDTRTILQSSWSIDHMDGTGPSGKTLDLTKTQILFIQAQWLGVGRVIVGFDIDGVLYPCHEFLNANVLAVPYCQSFNLPVRVELSNASGTMVGRIGYFDLTNGVYLKTSQVAAGGSIHFTCASVQSEGGEEARGFPRSASNGVTSIAVTTRRPVLSIRPKATYNSLTNRGHIEQDEFLLWASTNDAYYELVIGGVLTGASWNSVGAASIAEFDVAATAITGGVVIKEGYITTSGAGASAKGSASGSADIRNPLTISQINSLAATQIPLTIVCTSFSGTSNISAAQNWHEQVI